MSSTSNSGVFSRAHHVRFHEADPAGILFFGRVFEIAHGVYEDFVGHLGFTWKEWFNSPDWGVPLRHSSCEHLAPLKPGETYQVEIRVSKIGQSSMTLGYRFCKAQQVHSEVTLVHAFVKVSPASATSAGTIEKIAIPSKIRERLEAYQRQCV